MSISSNLISILKYDRFIKENEADAFHRYVDHGKEELCCSDDLLPTNLEEIRLEKTIVSRLNNLKVFLRIFVRVENLLKRTITSEVFDRTIADCNKTIAYIPQILSGNPVQNEQVKQRCRESFPDTVLERIIFDVKNIHDGKEHILIPADAFIAVPYRGEDYDAITVSHFGTPIEVHLRKQGKLKGRFSNTEYNYDISQVVFLKIVPAIDFGLDSGKLTHSEYGYIKKFVHNHSLEEPIRRSQKGGD